MAMNTVDAEVARLLEAGQNAVRFGDNVSARTYLTQVVERDPHNEQAWMWLSGVVTEPEEQQICLENVLVINPYNGKARQGLEFLSARTGIPTQAPPVPNEHTSPLSELTLQSRIQSPFTHTQLPAQEFAPAPAQAPPPIPLPDFSSEFSLPPWMETNTTPTSVPDPLAGAGGGFGSPAGMTPDAHSFDMFTQAPAPLPMPTPQAPDQTYNYAPVPQVPQVPQAPAADQLQSDPWGGMSVSSDSLNIDWSRGMDPAPVADSNANGNGNGNNYDSFGSFGEQQGNGNGNANVAVFGNGMGGELPGWSMDNMQGYQPIEPGSMGFGAQAPADPYAGTNMGQMDNMGQVSAGNDWNGDPSGAGGYGPMGPAGDFQLPQPTDLPGYEAAQQMDAKPWYAQSTSLSPGMLPDAHAVHGYGQTSDEMTQHLAPIKKDVPLVTCPNCAEQVPETSLACTRCGFSFFINCPHCHELVDVIEAKPDIVDPCPYCGNNIEKMKLGMTNADPTIAYVSQRPPQVDSETQQMKQYKAEASRRSRNVSWSWVVDVMWLVAVVLMVWVLTQLPTWWRLSGQY